MGVWSSVFSSPLAAPQTQIMHGLACRYTSKYLLFFLESDLQELAKSDSRKKSKYLLFFLESDLASSCKSDSRKKSKYLDVYLHARPCMIWVCGAASGDENTDDQTPTHDYPSL